MFQSRCTALRFHQFGPHSGNKGAANIRTIILITCPVAAQRAAIHPITPLRLLAFRNPELFHFDIDAWIVPVGLDEDSKLQGAAWHLRSEAL